MKKKVVGIILSIILGVTGFAFVACSAPTDYTVGIILYGQHAALTDAQKGFKEELTKLMKEKDKTIKYDEKDAANDSGICVTIANTLNTKKVDLMLAIATPAAQAAANATKESKIPVLFTATTDPIDAKLVASLDAPGNNLSGTSDLNDIKEQYELMKLLVPGLDTIAVLYTLSEPNSVIQKDMLKAFCDADGVVLLDKGISDTNTLSSTFTSIDKNVVDIIYIPTDNKLASAASAVAMANSDKKFPIVCGEINMNSACGVATYGIDYYQLGKQTAVMAFDILFNGKDISKMPVEFQDKSAKELSINDELAKSIGFTIPDTVRELKK